jgi:hypothetical protein
MIETCYRGAFNHPWTPTPINTHNPAGGIWAVKVNRFAIQVNGVVLQLRLKDFLGEGETKLG